MWIAAERRAVPDGHATHAGRHLGDADAWCGSRTRPRHSGQDKPAVMRWFAMIKMQAPFKPTYYPGSLLTEQFPHLAELSAQGRRRNEDAIRSRRAMRRCRCRFDLEGRRCTCRLPRRLSLSRVAGRRGRPGQDRRARPPVPRSDRQGRARPDAARLDRRVRLSQCPAARGGGARDGRGGGPARAGRRRRRLDLDQRRRGPGARPGSGSAPTASWPSWKPISRSPTPRSKAISAPSPTRSTFPSCSTPTRSSSARTCRST